jgi:hypothetical protein
MNGDGVLNPVDLEQKIQEISRRIHSGVHVVTKAEQDAREKRRLYDLAYARAYQAFKGPAHEKRYAAEEATTEQRGVAEDAEVVFRHAERTARALENELRATQSIGASVRAMYVSERGFGS